MLPDNHSLLLLVLDYKVTKFVSISVACQFGDGALRHTNQAKHVREPYTPCKPTTRSLAKTSGTNRKYNAVFNLLDYPSVLRMQQRD